MCHPSSNKRVKPASPWKVFSHFHTTASSRPSFGYSEGIHTYKEILRWFERFVEADAIVFTEHTSKPGSPRKLRLPGTTCEAILNERAQVHALRKQSSIGLYYGVECNVLKTGELDVRDKILKTLDVVIASRHALPKKVEKTPRGIFRTLTAAMENSQVHILGHPNRYIYEVNIDWQEIFEVARQTGTAIEINLTEWLNFDAKVETWADWLKILGESQAPVSIGWDFHNFSKFRRFKASSTEEELTTGINEALCRWTRNFEQALKNAEIASDRIITSTGSRFAEWIQTPKNERGRLQSKWHR